MDSHYMEVLRRKTIKYSKSKSTHLEPFDSNYNKSYTITGVNVSAYQDDKSDIRNFGYTSLTFLNINNTYNVCLFYFSLMNFTNCTNSLGQFILLKLINRQLFQDIKHQYSTLKQNEFFILVEGTKLLHPLKLFITLSTTLLHLTCRRGIGVIQRCMDQVQPQDLVIPHR